MAAPSSSVTSQSLRFSLSITPSPSHTFPKLPLPKYSVRLSRHVPLLKPILAVKAEVLVPDERRPPIFPTAGAPNVEAVEVDRVTEAELKENGFRSTRRTKIVCTIGPRTCGFDELEALAVGGMNVARINMCHGTREWHRQVIERVRRLNAEKGFAVAVMMDTQGSEIQMGDLGSAASAKAEVMNTNLLIKN